MEIFVGRVDGMTDLDYYVQRRGIVSDVMVFKLVGTTAVEHCGDSWNILTSLTSGISNQIKSNLFASTKYKEKNSRKT